MCKKLMLLSCLVTLLGLSNIAFADFEIFKVDFSCPADPATIKGGDWEDFEIGGGCIGVAHDDRTMLNVGGTEIDIVVGDPGGHARLASRESADPICNTAWVNHGGDCGDDLMRLVFRDLDPSTSYTVYTYHAWDDDGDFNSVNPVTIEGADSCSIPNPPGMVDTTSDAILLAHPNVGEIQFTTDGAGSEVRIKFNGCVKFNAFALWSEAALPRATSPNPGSAETDVCPKDLQLSWAPGADVNDANGHDVYLGTDYNDVRDANRINHPAGVIYSEGQDSNEYPEDGDPCLQLELMTTYYWRVDQVNDTDTWTGSIWSFTTEDGNARDPDPVVGFAGLNPTDVVLSWTPSCVATSQDVYFSTDFSDVNTLQAVAKIDTLSGTDNNEPVGNLVEFTTYYWRIDTTRSGGYGTGASEVWRFSTGLGGLLLEMLFEGSLGADLPATELDTSGNEFHFTTYSALHDPCADGSVKYGDGRKTGTSVAIDPCAGLYRVDTGESDPLRLAGWQYTIQMWVYLPAGVFPEEGWYMIVGKQDGWNIRIHDPNDNDDIRWYFGGMPDKGLRAQGILQEISDDWAHVAAVFDMTAQETHKLYIDGLIVDSGRYQSTNPADNNTPVGIGVGVANPPPFSFDHYFEGKIDELQIWDIVLEQVPEFASEPHPPDGSRGWQPNDVNLATFTWRPGKYAADVDGHDIYFGDSLDDVNESADPCVTGHDSNSWTHSETFEIGKTYYWRVDEVNGLDVYPGYIWKFQMWADLIDPNIVVYYPLDETSGDDVPDYSGNYFDAECDNDPHWEPDNGRYGGCMHFSMEYDADDDDWENEEPGNIEVESEYARQMADMINKEISICVWVNGDPDQREDDDMVVFEFCDDDYENDIDEEPNDTKILAVVPEEGTGNVVFRAGVYPQDTLTWAGFEPLAARGTWQHFVFIKNENDANMYIYLNNELVATKEDCNTTSLADVNSGGDAELELKLGAYVDNDSGYHGRLDEFQIYNKQLDELKIQEIFRGGELEPAWSPSPYDGQGNVSFTTDLTWKPGVYVADTNGHEVYFGTNYDEVFGANTTVHSNVEYSHQDACSYDPCTLLELGKTYYWRVDEVNDACDPNGWRGRVWRFTTVGYITIDDFEDDTAQNPPTNDWYEIASADITLRSTPPIIGKHSMKYAYYNSFDWGLGYYSEIESISLEPNDWTILNQKLKLLSLWFYGDSANAATETEQMYVYLKDNDDPCTEFQVKYGDADWEDMTDVQIEDWQEWLIPLSHFSTNDVNLANLDNLCIGFGTRGWPMAAGNGVVYFDNIRLYPAMCAPWGLPEGDLNGDCVVDYEDVKIMADAWLDSDCNCIEEYGEMPPPQGEPSLVAWYKFNDGSGGTATDSTSNNYHGTISVLDANVSWFTGHEGDALDFTGGWVSVPNGPTQLNLTNAVTVSCWINRAESSDDSIQLVCKGRDNWETYSLEVTGDENLKLGIRDPNGDDKGIESDKTLPLDEWLHIAGTCDGNNMTLYLNGRVEKTEEKGNFTFYADANDGLGIAERWGDDDFYPFIGTIDDVRIYDYALSGGEICYIASDGDGVAEMVNIANVFKPEGTKQVVNLRDFAKLANNWLKRQLWPL